MTLLGPARRLVAGQIVCGDDCLDALKCRVAGLCWRAENEAIDAEREARSAAAALARMDAGEPQQPARPTPTPTVIPAETEEEEPVASRKRWTRETAIAAIQKFHAEHGRPPRYSDYPNHSIPTEPVLTAIFGKPGFSSAIEAAGFERPTKASRGARVGHPAAASSAALPDPPPQREEPKPEDDLPVRGGLQENGSLPGSLDQLVELWRDRVADAESALGLAREKLEKAQQLRALAAELQEAL